MERVPYIMVVDDDVDTLKLIRRILELEGYAVSVATDSRFALASLEERMPDLILLDIMMPDLDGFQFLYLLRQRSGVPVIMLTGRTEMTLLKKALFLGADDYVKKPFSTRVLVARIQAKLRRARQKVDCP
ncbi:response regulator transcription factor [Chloroflexota bacterium]